MSFGLTLSADANPTLNSPLLPRSHPSDDSTAMIPRTLCYSAESPQNFYAELESLRTVSYGKTDLDAGELCKEK